MANPVGYTFPVQFRTWIQSPLPLLTTTVTVAPFRQLDWPVSQPAQPQVDLRTWTQFYNINLIGKDAFPVGKINIELTARQVQPGPIDLQSWLSWYNLNLIGKDQLPVGAIRTDLAAGQIPPRALDLQTWVQFYNVNLIGQDKLPTGKIRVELTEAQQKPARQVDLSWASSYNKNLIGKDLLPVGTQRTDTPAQLLYIDRASFTASYNRNLIGKDSFPFRVTDWPLPQQPADGRSWIATVNLALATAPVVYPFKQLDWPISFGARQPIQTFIASYNLNLIGKDLLPARMLDWRLTSPPATASTWVQSVNLALLQQRAPTSQLHWPLAVAAPQPDRSFAASFNLNLAGRDQLPVRVMDWKLPVAAMQTDRSFMASFNNNLSGVTPAPPGKRRPTLFMTNIGRMMGS